MIAPRQIERAVRVRHRTARGATQRRIAHKSRNRYSNIARLSLAIGSLLTIFMLYVVLTSSLTGMSYAVAHAEHQRDAMLEETMRLDDRIAALQSDQRLAALATRLGMADPLRIAVVRLPRPQAVDDRARVAVLSSLAGMLLPAAAHPR